ncbi:BlaI/MecI/CopY family transcriptional regulator [Hufsiella ginkgonis]|uniref:BlaI/MecI/CopY family transcriptional regulator n=1 Tax=Hufsiella ginkgonis TaxID=2695274 RepID=UPI001925F917|nr:BlaI/MecI/CopY family transcriptional regulator [Hufsiella ginkgonis]
MPPDFSSLNLIDAYPEPRPAATTVATLLKRMQDKGFVAYTQYGNSREYYALVKKADYFSTHMSGIIRNFFGNSVLRFASFFTESGNLTEAELRELRNIVDKEIEKKKND